VVSRVRARSANNPVSHAARPSASNATLIFHAIMAQRELSASIGFDGAACGQAPVAGDDVGLAVGSYRTHRASSRSPGLASLMRCVGTAGLNWRHP
jgi:hypothetical protein